MFYHIDPARPVVATGLAPINHLRYGSTRNKRRLSPAPATRAGSGYRKYLYKRLEQKQRKREGRHGLAMLREMSQVMVCGMTSVT